MMPIKVQDKQLRNELKLYISRVVTETLSDPDFGLDLNENIKKKLVAIRKGTIKTISLEAIKKKYSL